MVSSLKEQENFLRNAILTVDHSKEVSLCFLEQHLENNHQTFEDFLNQNQHDIYHLYYDAKCCRCGPGSPQKKKRILSVSQMELLFDKNRQLPIHKATRRSDFCCCYAKLSVTTAVLDLTLARCLILNYCIDMFWYSCLAFKGVTLEQFLNSNKHMLYHLWKNNTKCCKCQPDFIFPCNTSLIMESDWKKMFSSTLPPCENDRKRPVNGPISICAFSATPSITVQHIHLELQGIIIQYCCSTRKSVEKLAELRNLTFGHAKKASMSCTEFNTFMSEAENAILDIAIVCGKEDYYRQMLLDLRDKPLDTRMFCQYEKVLLQTISNYEDIIEDKEVLKDVIDSLKETIEKLETSQREVSRRQRIIDQTSAEIDTHEKDVAYVEIGAVRHCIKLLESRNVVVLTGREGSGKSRNGLEILRQLKEKNKDFDVFKLIGLTYVSDIVKKNVTSIVLFDDAFDNTSEHSSHDKQVLNLLYSYISQNKVKVIFTMRNNVRHACHMLLSTHRLFLDWVDIDLNSEKFQLTKVEKEKLLTTYCDINKIKISEGKEDITNKSVSNEAERDDIVVIQSVPDQDVVILKRELMNEIIQADPFLGFPECCRLFTENRKNTSLNMSCFKWPSSVLVNDIEKLRREGTDKYMIGLKYVLLIYILTQGKYNNLNTIRALARKDIHAETLKQIYNECYSKNYAVPTSDIEHVCKELIEDCYLVNKDGTFCFLHKAIQDSVLISYSKICPNVIVPLLMLDHIEDIVRQHDSIDQDDEVVIKISKSNYPELAKKIISLMVSRLSNRNELFRFIESKTIAESNVDLLYQLIFCIHNQSYIISLSYFVHDISCITDFIPLYLLSNIGKLDDNMLTVIHKKRDQMLISVNIGVKYVNFSVDPNNSIIWSFRTNYKKMVSWLFKNTNNSLLIFPLIFEELKYSDEVVKFTLENVNHDIIDMTALYSNIGYFNGLYGGKQTLEWIIDNIDNSLIDFDDCLKYFFENNFKIPIDFILKKVDHKLLDTNKVANFCCENGNSDLLELILQRVGWEFFEKEDLINIAIDSFVKSPYDDIFGHSKIVEILIQKPGIKYSNINKLVDVAYKGRWYNVLELLFIQDVDKSINKDKIVEDIYEDWNNENFQIYEVDVYEVAHFTKTVQLIMKYYSDHIVINRILNIAVEFGIHNCFEELLLGKVDNIPYYVNITLGKLRSEQLYRGFISFDEGHGKILLLLLQRINNKCMNLNSVMNDLCHIGHSSAVLLLLEKNPYHRFNMKNVMNKACYHGDIKLVDYLVRNYRADDFDFKTAMNKACRNSEGNVCNWLWANIERSMFDMKAALNNASKYDSTENVKWILTDVDTELYDIEAAVLCASEHGNKYTLQLLLKQSSLHMLDSQSALTLSCRNDRSCLGNAKLLYRHANKSNLDMNAILSEACKYFRTDFIQWIIETCNKNITVVKTNDGHEHFIKSLDKHCVDMDQALTFILDMKDPAQKKDHLNKTKKQLLMLILKQSDPSIIYIYTLLAETCKDDWVEIFQWILEKVDHAHLNIGEIINVACRFGAFNIIKWSLENIDMQLVDVDNVMVESCGFGWIDCLVLLLKHCNQYKLQEAMTEACSYGRLHIAEWLLQNVHSQFFNIPMLLQEAGRNGWINIFGWILQKFHLYKSDMHIATSQALENGHMEIAELVISTVGKDCFSFSSLSENTYMGANKEGVVNFLLHNTDHRDIDIAKIMTKACLFGWKDTASFILDNGLTSLCDLSLAFNTACDNGELEIAELLLHQVDPHILTTVDKAMHSVAVKGWDEIALLLIDNVEHTRLDIGNAFIEACRHGEIDVVQAILQKVDNNMLDIEAALNKACENHMHEELVLWILENIDQEQVDLKTVKTQAFRHKWWKVKLAILEGDTDDLREVEIETETDVIVIS